MEPIRLNAIAAPYLWGQLLLSPARGVHGMVIATVIRAVAAHSITGLQTSFIILLKGAIMNARA